MDNSIAAIRKEYRQQSLDESIVSADPIQQFEKWWKDVLNSSVEEPNAMTLATATASGKPSARIVLLKGINEDGFVFFTNYQSHKGKEILENPFASLVFFWKELERQVRIEGSVSKIPAADSDDYFHSRPIGSRIGAWASPQSMIIRSREILELKYVEAEKAFDGKQLDRPPHWGGYVIRPNLVEFWQGRPNRLHDRIQYTLETGWRIDRLAP